MTDELSLLLEAFALEAGDQVKQLTQALKRLERTPTNAAGWRSATASFRLIADSAVLMELPDVQELAQRGRDACQEMASHPDWQRVEVVKLLQEGTAALDRLLAALASNSAGRPEAFAEGTDVFEDWRRLVGGAATSQTATPPTPIKELPVEVMQPDVEAATLSDIPLNVTPVDRMARWRRGLAGEATPQSPAATPAPSASTSAAPEPLAAEASSGTGRVASIDAELIEIFTEELGEHLMALDDYLLILDQDPDDHEALHNSQRSLHTVKGAAGMIGLATIQSLGLVSEETIEQFVEARAAAPSDLLYLIHETVRVLHRARKSGFDETSLVACEDVGAQWHLFTQIGMPTAAETPTMTAAELAMAETIAAEMAAEAAAIETEAAATETLEDAVPESLVAEAAATETLEDAVLDSLVAEAADEYLDGAALDSLVAEMAAQGLDDTVIADNLSIEEATDDHFELVIGEPELNESDLSAGERLEPAADQIIEVEAVDSSSVPAELEPPSWVADLDEATLAEADDHGLIALEELTDAVASEVMVDEGSTTDEWRVASQPIQLEAGQFDLAEEASAVWNDPDVGLTDQVLTIDYPHQAVADELADDHLLDIEAQASDQVEETDEIDEIGSEMATGDQTIPVSVDDELLVIFASEAAEGLQAIDVLLARLNVPPTGMTLDDEASGANQSTMLDLRRQVHTIKGAAGMMGQQEFSSLAHRMEDLLERLVEQALPLTSAIVGLMYDTVDGLRILTSGPLAPTTLRALTTRYTAALGAAQIRNLHLPRAAELPVSVQPNSNAPVVRLEIEKLNELSSFTEELVTNRAGFEERLSQVGGLLRDFERSVERLVRVSRSLEYDYESWGVASDRPVVEEDDFDILEFDRYTEFHRLATELAEAVADARTISRDVTSNMAALNTLVTRQGRVTTSMRERLDSVRVVSLSGLIPAARRIVTQTVQHENKQATLDVEGFELNVDRTVFDALNTALGHILRNAIVHGIEDQAERQAAGKPVAGRIILEARAEPHETVVIVRDDGRGIDRQKVRSVAEAEGWIKPKAKLSDAQVLGLIFRPGLSTATTVDEVSGRGVGMDAAQAAIASVRGRIDVESEPGGGTIFTFHLPLVQTVAELLLVEAGGRRLALPMTWLVNTLRVETSRLRRTMSGHEYEVAGRWLPVTPLASLVGWSTEIASQPSWPALIAQIGSQVMILLVDSLIQRQELAVSSLGPSFGWLRSVQGACVLGSGEVAPVLDLAVLLDQGQIAAETLVEATRAVRILVVDDSVSVRRVVSLTLERQGWEVIQARNGHEALAALATGPADAAIVDVEMPQMDGYTLLERLRTDEHLSSLPVVMLTSRGAEKHRQRAIDMGAQAYLVKPYQEEHLLKTLQQLLGDRVRPTLGTAA